MNAGTRSFSSADSRRSVACTRLARILPTRRRSSPSPRSRWRSSVHLRRMRLSLGAPVAHPARRLAQRALRASDSMPSSAGPTCRWPRRWRHSQPSRSRLCARRRQTRRLESRRPPRTATRTPTSSPWLDHLGSSLHRLCPRRPPRQPPSCALLLSLVITCRRWDHSRDSCLRHRWRRPRSTHGARRPLRMSPARRRRRRPWRLRPSAASWHTR